MYWNVLVCLVSILIIVWIVFSNKKTKKNAVGEIPGPEPSNLKEGNIPDVKSAGSLHDYLRDLHGKYGAVAAFWMAKERVVSIASAEMFKQHQHHFDRPVSLFQMQAELIGPNSIQLQNGIEGQRLHKALSRPFAFNECKKYYNCFHEVGKELMDKLEALAPSTSVPIWEYMTVVAIKGLLTTAFGHRLTDDKIALELNANYEVAWHKIESYFKKSVPEDFTEQEIKTALKAYRKFAEDLLDARRRNEEPREDDLFVDVVLNYGESEEHQLDNAVTFITGGFHTTSCLLTWALYFLAKDQVIQEKVHSELKQVLGNDDVTPETFKDLKYLQRVLDETLRASTLAPYAARCSDKDTELGGYRVVAGTPVIHALGVALNDENVWESPDEFDPDRFLPNNAQSRSSLAFSPFGFAGKRICPGYRFAYVESTIILSLILRRMKFLLVEGQDIHRVFGLVTKPSSEIWMRVEAREDAGHF